jgi:hypothetical protein
VSTPGFELELRTLEESTDQVVARQAAWVLAALRRGVHKPSHGAV